MSKTLNNQPPVDQAEMAPRFRMPAVLSSRAAALGMTVLLSACGNFQPSDLVTALENVPVTIESVPTPDEVRALEQTYPSYRRRLITEEQPTYNSKRTYDIEKGTDSILVYRYDGLENLSFVLPKLSVAEGITNASSVAELEEQAAPYFESLGLKLFITSRHPGLDRGDIELVTPEEVKETRIALASAINAIAVTPLEIIKASGVNDIVLAHVIHAEDIEGQPIEAAGIAVHSEDAMVFDVGMKEAYHRNVWHHELGHFLHEYIQAASDDEFNDAYKALNPDWFIYRETREDLKMSKEAFEKIRAAARKVQAVESDYSAEALGEDVANLYASLYGNDTTPDPMDPSFEEIVGWKRIMLVEALNQAVPGFKAYMLGITQGDYPYPYLYTPLEVPAWALSSQ